MSTETTASARQSGNARALLTAGVIAGPLFSVVVIAQELTRAGFDPKINALSQLSTGDLGWLQITNFVVTGVLILASSIGIRRRVTTDCGRTWAPILFGVYGGAMIMGGVFVTDPAFGYPPGTPEGAPDTLSWHGLLHSIAPAVAGIALIAAYFVFARRYLRQGRRGAAIACWLVVAVYLLSSAAAFGLGDFRYMLAGGIVCWVGASLITADLLRAPAPATS